MRKHGVALFAIVLMGLWSAPVQAQSFYRLPSLAEAQSAFGGAVAVGEGEVFIGEPQGFKYPGTVHVFRRGGSGAWEETASLRAADGAVGDGFGEALVVAGNTLLVGRTGADDNRGAVYVFERDAATGAWTETARLAADDGAAGDRLGEALALHGDLAFAGADRHNERAGAVYVFRKNADGAWTQHAKLTGSDAETGHGFGASLAVQGDRLLVGAPMQEQATGAVYVFGQDAAGAWAERGKLAGEGVESRGRFGAALNLDGNEAVVGAPGFNQSAGAVFVFRHAASGQWTARGRLEADAPGERDFFGTSVYVNGDELWVGAPGTAQFAGALHRFTRAADGAWTPATVFTDSDGATRDFFGGTMALHGNLAVVSASGADYGEGIVHVFERDGAAAAWQKQTVLMSADESMDPIVGGKVECNDGAAGAFACSEVDLIAFLPLKDMNIARGVRLNDIWGWTDPDTGKEYALVGHMEATAFVDVSDPFNPVFLGELLRTADSPGSTWRDIKVYKDHAFIVADGAGSHGMQVFDLRQLRDVQNPPVTFTETVHYDQIHSAHNIVINEETGFAYTVGNNSGGETCGGGLHMIDIREPAHPVFVGCFGHEGTGRGKTGYSHDAQCVIYQGPDAPYRGKEICFGANETAISISDVTDKENPVPISSGSYPDYAYVHQGWLSDDHRYFFQNDETDELSGKVERTRTLIWDVTDLDDPQLAGAYYGPTSATDHNLYVKGTLMYQTNNASGLRIIDVSDPVHPVEVGHFDTTPYGTDTAGFNGTWSSYPYFKSGMIVVSSRREGLFILKKRDVDI